MKIFTAICLVVLYSFALVSSEVEADVKDEKEVEESTTGNEEEVVDPAKVEYAKGSVCSYCSYCEFCKLCSDCPCETSKSKPNCKMCKYCKFCYLCDAFCDTVCTAGGILDRVSGAIVNSLPTFNKEEVDGDIDSVKDWIKRKDEL
ncbi:sarcoplasmic reticulum histidine-rich calcium-binding protein-like [Biomphalaria glabrata]|uniref:Sarcoplasmic reticulum histidine-rich calcium-binding protein-like n=1 Tax=Biomphalaria glabrata TaxID=6526 RepID=A0A9U8DWP4_BIOGL|nr:sarcoplasmic reticulum histidine-rich calcium-binding protein-like [Biomphalaria glabrata]